MDAMTHDAAMKLLHHNGYPSSIKVIDMSAGRVNRNYKLEFKDMPSLRLKCYFSEFDQRDRCLNEFEFSRYAWSSGVHNIPKPIGYDSKTRIGLYSYLEGESIVPPVRLNDIDACVSFFRAINRNRSQYSSKHSRTYNVVYSVTEYIAEVERRFSMFDEVIVESDIDREAEKSIIELIGIKNEKVVALEALSDLPYRYCRAKRIHPGDFSFRNVLRYEGKLYFLDFEYARLDDPVCVICDFLAQSYVTQYKIQSPYDDMFIRNMLETLEYSEEAAKRLDEYWILCLLRYCCVVFNIFLPIGRAKQRFSGKQTGLDSEKIRRLDIAKLLVEGIKNA